jgi:predicted aspartyl protease
MSEYPYDVTHDPPIPVCDLVLIAPATGRKIALTVIVDTGADGTIVPIHYLEEVGARRTVEVGLRSQWCERRTVFLYLVDLQIGQVTLPGIYVVGDDLGQEAVLGRDVLNRLRLLLDGPAAMTQLLNQ